MRGPEEGQVTLVPKATPIGLSKSKGKGKGRGKEVAQPKLIDDANGFVEDGCFDEYDAWIDEDAKPCTSPTNEVYDRTSVDTLRPDLISEDEDEPTPRVLDVVRIPNSQLRFFPKSHKPPDASRHSLEYDLRRTSIERSSAPLRRRSSAEGPSIQNNLRTLPRPLQPSKPQPTPPLPKSSKIVRLRPPSATAIPKPSPSSNSLAHRLSSLFVVPPPPSPLPLPARSAPRLSMESRSSRASSPSQAKPVQPEVVLEMHPRKSIETTRTNGGWTPVDKGRKSR